MMIAPTATAGTYNREGKRAFQVAALYQPTTWIFRRTALQCPAEVPRCITPTTLNPSLVSVSEPVLAKSQVT